MLPRPTAACACSGSSHRGARARVRVPPCVPAWPVPTQVRGVKLLVEAAKAPEQPAELVARLVDATTENGTAALHTAARQGARAHAYTLGHRRTRARTHTRGNTCTHARARTQRNARTAPARTPPPHPPPSEVSAVLPCRWCPSRSPCEGGRGAAYRGRLRGAARPGGADGAGCGLRRAAGGGQVRGGGAHRVRGLSRNLPHACMHTCTAMCHL